MPNEAPASWRMQTPDPASRVARDVIEAPAILDMEASGFGKDSYPIEVGFVLPNGKSYCSLIRPAADWTHWDDTAEALHHITRDLVVRRGQDPREVALDLNEQLAGQTVYSDGWVNDYTWLALLYDQAATRPTFRLDSLRSLLTEDEAERWHVVKQEVSNELKVARHRASSDAMLLQATWKRLAAMRRPVQKMATGRNRDII